LGNIRRPDTSRTSTGDDHDTFFDPDGTVIVAGTTGGVSIRSFRFGQRAEYARIGAVAATCLLRYDRADLQLGHDRYAKWRTRYVCRRNEPRIHQFPQHEVAAGANLSRRTRAGWTLKMEGQGDGSAHVGRWPIELSLDAGRTWSYRSAAALSRTTLGLLFRVGLAPTI